MNNFPVNALRAINGGEANFLDCGTPSNIIPIGVDAFEYHGFFHFKKINNHLYVYTCTCRYGTWRICCQSKPFKDMKKQFIPWQYGRILS